MLLWSQGKCALSKNTQMEPILYMRTDTFMICTQMNEFLYHRSGNCMNQKFRDNFENAHKWKWHHWDSHVSRIWCMHNRRAFNISAYRVGVTVAKVINISWGVFSPSKGKLFSLTAAQISKLVFEYFIDYLVLKYRNTKAIFVPNCAKDLLLVKKLAKHNSIKNHT